MIKYKTVKEGIKSATMTKEGIKSATVTKEFLSREWDGIITLMKRYVMSFGSEDSAIPLFSWETIAQWITNLLKHFKENLLFDPTGSVMIQYLQDTGIMTIISLFCTQKW